MNGPKRFRRRVLVAGLCGVTAAGLLATGAVASPGRSTSATPLSQRANARPRLASAVVAERRATALGLRGSLRYAVQKPGCAKPVAPDYVSCFALRLVPASKSTKGAFAYVGPSGSTGPAGGYTPADLAGAYGYDPKHNKGITSKQTIGIIDWYDDPSALADLNTFDKNYGFAKETKTSFRKVNQKGKTSPLPAADSQAPIETALDIEAARSVCRYCRILLVEANGPYNSDLEAAENTAARLGATEISNSFGEPETGVKPSSKFAEAFDHPGVVITASTGDNGWFGWDYANAKGGESQNAASFPASSDAVVSVGGTYIGIENDKRAGEVVWNENGPADSNGGDGPAGATGSGCSTKFAAAPWQKAFANYKANGCKGGRLSSDVSAIADPNGGLDIYVSDHSTGWQTIGGTSLASPVIASMYALAGGSHGAAYPAATLYVNAALHPKSLFDVVSYDPSEFAAGNSVCGGVAPVTCYDDFSGNPNGFGVGLLDCSLPRNGSTPSGTVAASRECNVAKGLDGPTGLGTPNSLRLMTSTTPTMTLRGPSSAKKGRKVTFAAKAKEIISKTKIEGYAIFWGDGKETTSRTGSAKHAFAKAGTYTVEAFAVDSRNQISVRSLRITVKR